MTDEQLRTLLQQHDPASGKMLDAGERMRIVDRALNAPRVWRTQVAFAFAALIVAFLASVATMKRPAVSTPEPALQIRYATPGGTRVVWTLDPNFHL